MGSNFNPLSSKNRSGRNSCGSFQKAESLKTGLKLKRMQVPFGIMYSPTGMSTVEVRAGGNVANGECLIVSKIIARMYGIL